MTKHQERTVNSHRALPALTCRFGGRAFAGPGRRACGAARATRKQLIPVYRSSRSRGETWPLCVSFRRFAQPTPLSRWLVGLCGASWGRCSHELRLLAVAYSPGSCGRPNVLTL